MLSPLLPTAFGGAKIHFGRRKGVWTVWGLGEHSSWRMGWGNLGNLIGFGLICVILQFHGALAGVLYKTGVQNARRLIEETGNRNVVYEMDDGLDSAVHECVNGAMKEISKHSCVRFIDLKTISNESKVFLRILAGESPNQCHSWPTNSYGLEAINVTLGGVCGGQERQCMRTLLGALGMAIENERPDRNQFIHVNRSNVQPESIGLFDRMVSLENVDLVTKYDVSSVMHFTSQEYSKSRDLVVITTNNHLLDESVGGEIRGRRHSLSHRDKETINQLFQCATNQNHEPAKHSCQRNGYLGEKGECVCPHAFSGSRCEILSYSGRFNVPTCGILTDRQGDVVSPNYPDRYSRGAFCQWLIEGKSPGDRILFRINDLDLEHEHLMAGDRCADKLTIWPHGTDVVTKSISCLPEEASRYKGKWYSTQYNWLLIEFRSDSWGQYDHQGFNISYKIIDPPTPPPRKTPSGLTRHEEWRRKLGEKWSKAGNEKEAVLDFGQDRMTAASVKTRLLNTIGRQGQLFCYGCDNETHCQDSLQRRPCPHGQACAYQSSEHGMVTWRGCLGVDSCTDTWPSIECTESETDIPEHCFQCCATDLCNMAMISDYMLSAAPKLELFELFATLIFVTVASLMRL